ncbi:MAG: fumarate hydratase [Spirochaetota bacterium]
MTGKTLTDAVIELIRVNTSTLPDDITSALHRAATDEAPGSSARAALEDIVSNIDSAKARSLALCQDTGYPTFFVRCPPAEWTSLAVPDAIRNAVRAASERSYLRPNTISTVDGRSYPDNVFANMPTIHVEPDDIFSIAMLQKGGGSENVSAQISLPDMTLGAGRDSEGVFRAVMRIIVNAEGNGCAPGILGVAIGGDRESAWHAAKMQLFRPLDDENPNTALSELEKRILTSANDLGIGPMGLGGKTTLLGVKLCSLARVPACYFVTVSYGCYALRRRTMTITDGGCSIA